MRGTEKRNPLDEAKPLGVLQRAHPPLHHQTTGSERPADVPNPPSTQRGVPDITQIVSWSSAASEATRLNAFSYEFYAASSDAKNQYTHMPVLPMLAAILDHAKADRALDPALQALSLRVCAMYRRDPLLLATSKQRYTTALGALQVSLNHPDGAVRDETLVVAVIMALYEVRPCPFTSPGSWCIDLDVIVDGPRKIWSTRLAESHGRHRISAAGSRPPDAQLTHDKNSAGAL